MTRYNTKEIAENIVKTFKLTFNDVNIVPAKKNKCAICGKLTRKGHELRIRGRNRINRRGNGYIGSGMYMMFVGGKNKAFKHLAYVCSKECEIMLILAVG